MELALTTLLLLPGVVSLAIATGPRCRAFAPRDLPGALVGTLAFAITNFVVAVAVYRLIYDAPFFGAKIAALVIGKPYQQFTQQNVVADAFDAPGRLLVGAICVGAASVATGACGAYAYTHLLRVLARSHSPELARDDTRFAPLKWMDAVLKKCGATNLVMARGASYWLVVEQAAELRSGADDEGQVYADIVQGDRWKLYTGKVNQVIASRAGETISVLLESARRYRFEEVGDDIDPATGKKRIVKTEGWTKISDSEAFYMRGENIHNISYRVYGDLARGGYTREHLGTLDWIIPARMLRDLRAQLGARLIK